MLAASGTSVTHCPMTAMKGAYGAASAGRFPEMAAAGVNLQLGTDGNNNGNASDMMRAMFCMAGIHKDARREAGLFSAYRVYSADGRGVHSVWVDGRRVVENYRSTLIDEEKLLADVEAAGIALVVRAGHEVPCEWPVL